MQEKEDIFYKEKRKQHFISWVIWIAIILIPLVLILSFYIYIQTPEYKIKIGANIEKATISEDGKSMYIRFGGGINEKKITKVKFTFVDRSGNLGSYETSEGIQEISVPIKNTFYDWMAGNQFRGEYNYRLEASEANMENFKNISEVDVVFEYEKPALDTSVVNQLKTIFRFVRKQ